MSMFVNQHQGAISRLVQPGALLSLILVLLVLSACLPPPEEGDEPRRHVTPAEYQPDLAAPSDQVRTIQLYRGSDERAAPILRLRGGDRLTLAFDKMGTSGRPVSVYFYQKNARWERTLSSSEYMESFASDNIFDYQRSQGTDIDYVHYRYSFPNDQINFRIGGNYVLRVTEQGRESDVLFEKAFYITEGRGQVGIQLETIATGGQRYASRRPIVQFHPSGTDIGSQQDYSACVLRDGRTTDMRCTDRARVASHPAMRFEINRELAFRPVRTAHQLDLSRLQAGGQIDAINRQERPPHINLRPDYPQFQRDVLREPLFGQSVIGGAAAQISDPHVRAEYVRVRFSLASVPRRAGIALSGTFLSGRSDGLQLVWSDSRERFEVETLVKQGWHEYWYVQDGESTTDSLDEDRGQVGPHRYTALVYYRDIQLNTHRIVGTESVMR